MKNSHPALLCEKLPNGKVRCHICQRRCEIVRGQRGWCFTRENMGGELYTLTYGEVSSIAVSPIEKKPLFHFYPGSRWLSLGSLGCNFHCPGCQNWDIAHSRVDGKDIRTEYMTPQRLIEMAEDNACAGISFTYNEPTLWFEYTLDVARRAKNRGLMINYVTNGSITAKALDLIGPYLDSFRVDIKGFYRDTYKKIAHLKDPAGIREVTLRAKMRWGVWVEVITNIIPGYNDGPEEIRAIASWISTRLGRDTPWHITRFVPHLELIHLDTTSVKSLEMAWKIGRDEGLKYVYLGNVPGHRYENTYCHKCKGLLIGRFYFEVKTFIEGDGICPHCQSQIPGRFLKDDKGYNNQ